MKITLIHGENITESRKRFVTILSGIKGRGWEIVKINPKNTLLHEALQTPSMFSETSLYVHESVDKLTKPEIDWVSQNETYNANLLLWSKKKLTAAFIKKLPKNTNVELFDVPRELFSLLSQVYPPNANLVLQKLHAFGKNEPLEFVFAMIARQMRDVYWAAIDPDSLGYPDWRVRKLQSQANRFVLPTLVNFIDDLAKADLASKTSSQDISKLLDLAVIRHLQ